MPSAVFAVNQTWMVAWIWLNSWNSTGMLIIFRCSHVCIIDRLYNYCQNTRLFKYKEILWKKDSSVCNDMWCIGWRMKWWQKQFSLYNCFYIYRLCDTIYSKHYYIPMHNTYVMPNATTCASIIYHLLFLLIFLLNECKYVKW